MRVFVTGAGGFVGRAVVRRLLHERYTVRVLMRRGSKSGGATGGLTGVETHVGNILEPTSLMGAAEDVDAIIHLVGIISEVDDNTFENVHSRGTQNVVALAEQGNVRRFIHMSALGTRANAVSRYHQTKWAGEESVRKARLDYTILRPSLIYGSEDHFVNLFARIITLSPIVPIIGTGRARLQPVAVETVAAAFTRAVAEPGSIGKTFDLCGRETLTLPEIVDAILAAMRKKRLKVKVPLPVARFQARCLEFIYPRLLRKAPPLNREQIIMLEEDNVGNAEPANRTLKLDHGDFRDSIARYLKPATPAGTEVRQ